MDGRECVGERRGCARNKVQGGADEFGKLWIVSSILGLACEAGLVGVLGAQQDRIVTQTTRLRTKTLSANGRGDEVERDGEDEK